VFLCRIFFKFPSSISGMSLSRGHIRTEPHPTHRQLFEARERWSKMYHWVPLVTTSLVSLPAASSDSVLTFCADRRNPLQHTWFCDLLPLLVFHSQLPGDGATYRLPGQCSRFAPRSYALKNILSSSLAMPSCSRYITRLSARL
jgi:hypothetical protein